MHRLCIIIAEFRNKLNCKKGFSFTELLACVLILLLSTGLIVSTLVLGLKQFQARTRESEALMLSDSLAAEVQEQLTWGEDFTESNGTVNSFHSLLWKDYTCSFQLSEDGKLQMFLEKGDTSINYPLLSDASYTGNGDLYVNEFSVKKESGLLLVKICVDSKKYTIQKAENTFTVSPRTGS